MIGITLLDDEGTDATVSLCRDCGGDRIWRSNGGIAFGAPPVTLACQAPPLPAPHGFGGFGVANVHLIS